MVIYEAHLVGFIILVMDEILNLELLAGVGSNATRGVSSKSESLGHSREIDSLSIIKKGQAPCLWPRLLGKE